MENSLSKRQFEIIEVAGKILTANGVGGLTTKKIANEMGFSEAAIYRHFKSKEAILIAMLKYLAQNMDSRLSMVVEEKNTAEENLVQVFSSQFTYFAKNPHFAIAIFSDNLMEGSDQINKGISELMRIKRKHLEPIIKAGQKEEVFTNKIQMEDLLHIIMGTFRLQIFKWKSAQFGFDIKKIGNNRIQSMLTLIKNK